MRWLQRNWHRPLAHAGALLPLVGLFINYWRDDLTFNSVRFVTLRTGSVGLLLLVLSLACTPLNTLFGWRGALHIRRPLGLYAFLYITLHLLLYVWFDAMLDMRFVWRDLSERRSMLVGLVAFLLLVPLALTSTQRWQRRLGRGWRMLHRLVYLATPLSVLHFFWLDRDFIRQPVIYAVAVGVLLALRLPPVRRAIGRGRALLVSAILRLV